MAISDALRGLEIKTDSLARYPTETAGKWTSFQGLVIVYAKSLRVHSLAITHFLPTSDALSQTSSESIHIISVFTTVDYIFHRIAEEKSRNKNDQRCIWCPAQAWPTFSRGESPPNNKPRYNLSSRIISCVRREVRKRRPVVSWHNQI